MITVREKCMRRIAAVLAEIDSSDINRIRSALRANAPWGSAYERKVWYDEARRQLEIPRHPRRLKKSLSAERARGQRYLFIDDDLQPLVIYF